jgi:hypothetical protein
MNGKDRTEVPAGKDIVEHGRRAFAELARELAEQPLHEEFSPRPPGTVKRWRRGTAKSTTA